MAKSQGLEPRIKLRALEEVLVLAASTPGVRFGELQARLADRRHGHGGVLAELEFCARMRQAAIEVSFLEPPGPDFLVVIDREAYQIEVKDIEDKPFGDLRIKMGELYKTTADWMGDCDAWARAKLRSTLRSARARALRRPEYPTIALLADRSFMAREALWRAWERFAFYDWNRPRPCGALLGKTHRTQIDHAHPNHRWAVERLRGLLNERHVFMESIF